MDMHNINYSDIRKKIQHCSNELNDALKMVNDITPTSENQGKYYKLIYWTYYIIYHFIIYFGKIQYKLDI